MSENITYNAYDKRSMSEFVLRAGGTYRVDIEGLDAGVKAIIRFYWYEDLGV
jgi:hypothetical protein